MSDEDRDDKAAIRGELDLAGAVWVRAEPPGEHIEDAIEVAHIEHTDGVTYTALRVPSKPHEPTLVFTPAEWEAFTAGARDGEFDLP